MTHLMLKFRNFKITTTETTVNNNPTIKSSSPFISAFFIRPISVKVPAIPNPKRITAINFSAIL